MALLPQSVGFSLEGHPVASYNGVYRKVSEHKGWPVLQREPAFMSRAAFCYYYEPTYTWFLSPQQSPDKGAGHACIASVDGPLPSGAQTWQVAVGGKFVDQQLRVSVMA